MIVNEDKDPIINSHTDKTRLLINYTLNGSIEDEKYSDQDEPDQDYESKYVLFIIFLVYLFTLAI